MPEPALYMLLWSALSRYYREVEASVARPASADPGGVVFRRLRPMTSDTIFVFRL